jgi:predicted nucleic acid-binding protein
VAPKRKREVVIDASLAINFAVPGYPYYDQAQRLFAEWDKKDVVLISPHLYEAEVDTGLRRLVYHKALTPTAGKAAQDILDALSVRLVYNRKVRQRARQIAEQFNQSRVYDSIYAALAELRHCEFWTADEKFYKAVSGRLKFVRFIGNY